jgi:hypothetical protein
MTWLCVCALRWVLVCAWDVKNLSGWIRARENLNFDCVAMEGRLGIAEGDDDRRVAPGGEQADNDSMSDILANTDVWVVEISGNDMDGPLFASPGSC